jgi:hypothetical protein
MRNSMSRHLLIVSALLVVLAGSKLPTAVSQSSSAAPGRPVLRANGGTWTFGPAAAPPATLVWYEIVVPKDFVWDQRFQNWFPRTDGAPWELIEQISFTLQGPPGWGSNVSLSWEEKVRSYSITVGHTVHRQLPAVAGAYSLTAVVNGREKGTATFSIDPSRVLARPAFRVRTQGQTYIVDYDAVPGAYLYHVIVERLGTSQANAHSSTFAPGRATAGVPPGRYRVSVSAYTWDPNTGARVFTHGVHGSEASPQEFVIP